MINYQNLKERLKELKPKQLRTHVTICDEAKEEIIFCNILSIANDSRDSEDPNFYGDLKKGHPYLFCGEETIVPMTYQDLLEEINKLNPKQLKLLVTIFDEALEEFIYIDDLEEHTFEIIHLVIS